MNYNAEHVAIPGEENEIIDFKIVKRHFPRTNNTQVLDFVFEKVRQFAVQFLNYL